MGEPLSDMLFSLYLKMLFIPPDFMKCYLERFAVQISLYSKSPLIHSALGGDSLGSAGVSDLSVLWFQARIRFSERIKPQSFVCV